MISARFLVPLLALAAVELRAQTDFPVPAIVEHVVTGGWWSSGTNRGTYRLVVASGGFEHVTSAVYAEWVRERRSERDSAVVLATKFVKEVNESGLRLAAQPTMRKDTAFVAFVDPHVLNSRVVRRCTIVFGAPGVYRATCRES